MIFLKKLFHRRWTILLISLILGFGIAFLFARLFLNFEHRSVRGKLGIMTVLPAILGIFIYLLIQNINKLYFILQKNIDRFLIKNINRIYSIIQKSINSLSVCFDSTLLNLDTYIKQNSRVITFLGIVALAAYGFELFNFNLTVDEELHAFFTEPSLLWIGEGRWGMYILNKFILPYTVIPVVSLFLALVFHILAILIILNCWGVNSKLEQVVAGTMMLTFPTLAYIYMFSTLSFGIGIGFFCIALSLYLYKKDASMWWLAVIPAAFSLAIYQAFLLVLAVVYVVYLIVELGKINYFWTHVLRMIFVALASFFIYYIIQKLWVWLLIETLSAAEKSAYFDRYYYTQRYFDLISLRENTLFILSRTWEYLVQYYSGYHSDYVIVIGTLGWVVIFSLIGIILNLINQKKIFYLKILSFLFSLTLLGLPFFGVLFSNGRVLTRSLLALPFALAGVFIVGAPKRSTVGRVFIFMLSMFCVFQFILSANRLFGSSHLMLQADRLVAVRLMERIDKEKEISGIQNPIYLEVVGRLPVEDNYAIPRSGTFGLSFFELAQTSQPRIASFLELLGYQSFKSLPLSRLSEFVEITENMSIWPAEGSVTIVGDTVLIKFGDYTDMTKLEICAQPASRALPEDFCPIGLEGKPIIYKESLPDETTEIKYRFGKLTYFQDSIYVLVGSAYFGEKSDSPQFDRYVVLRSDTETYLFPVITTKLHFSVRMSKELVQLGSYRVGVLFRDRSNNIYYKDTDQVIVRTYNSMKIKEFEP